LTSLLLGEGGDAIANVIDSSPDGGKALCNGIVKSSSLLL